MRWSLLSILGPWVRRAGWHRLKWNDTNETIEWNDTNETKPIKNRQYICVLDAIYPNQAQIVSFVSFQTYRFVSFESMPIFFIKNTKVYSNMLTKNANFTTDVFEHELVRKPFGTKTVAQDFLISFIEAKLKNVILQT